MTQIARYGQLMKVQIDRVRMQAAAHWTVSGSVLAQTIKAGLRKIETKLEVESPDPPQWVAAVLRNAENGCWAQQAVRNPVPIEATITLNGAAFNAEGYPPPQRR